MDNIYNPAEAIKAQEEYCTAKHVPRFAPANGMCTYCQEQIYAPRRGKTTGGISLKEAGSRMVTGCPHCHRSFCE